MDGTIAVDAGLFERLIRTLEQHDSFVGAVKNEVGYCRTLGTEYSGISDCACRRIIANYPEDPYLLLKTARKAQRRY